MGYFAVKNDLNLTRMKEICVYPFFILMAFPKYILDNKYGIVHSVFVGVACQNFLMSLKIVYVIENSGDSDKMTPSQFVKVHVYRYLE